MAAAMTGRVVALWPLIQIPQVRTPHVKCSVSSSNGAALDRCGYQSSFRKRIEQPHPIAMAIHQGFYKSWERLMLMALNNVTA